MNETSLGNEATDASVAAYDTVANLARMGITLDCEEILSSTTLTPRETEITTLIMRGFNNKQISVRLTITTSTLRTHIKRIYRKMGSHSKSNLILRVIGLLADKVSRERGY